MPFRCEWTRRTLRDALALTCEPLTELRVSPPGVSTSEAALASLEEGVPPGATAVMVAQSKEREREGRDDSFSHTKHTQ